MNVLKATTNHPDNGERMRNLLRGREALDRASVMKIRGRMYK
ncbi:MAG: hypothetical protein ACLRTS_22555 [Parabacteroides distasonis]